MIYNPPAADNWSYDSQYEDSFNQAYLEGYDAAAVGVEFSSNIYSRWEERFWWNTGWLDGAGDNSNWEEAPTNV